jgi:hypothetical protein
MPKQLRAPLSALPLLLASLLPGCGGGAAISVTVSQTTPQIIDAGNSAAVSATVNDSRGVTWSVSCAVSPCGQISPMTSMSGAQVTFTAPNPNPSTSALTVTITATAVTDLTKSASGQVTVAASLTLPNPLLPDGTVGAAYSQSLQASGGIPPYIWTPAQGSSLPAGLSLSSSGAVTGTPIAAGNMNFDAQITDSGNPALVLIATANISINTGPVAVATTSLPSATIDTAFTQVLQATGGIPPYTWSLASGSMPSWATLDSAGRIRGIPGATASAVNFTVQVTDAEFQPLSAAQGLSIDVVSGSSASDGLLNGHYAFFFNGFDDVSGAPIAIAGSFTADGAGNITAGIEDENGSAAPALNIAFTGTYNIAADQRGAFTLQTTSGTKTFACALGTLISGVATKGRFIEFDDFDGSTGQRGSGILRLQDTSAFTLASITGPYAFGFSGEDGAGKREVRVGRFDADGSGGISNGIQDANDASVVSDSVGFIGDYTAPSASNGRATLSMTASGSNAVNFAAYIISASEIVALSSDSIASGMAGGLILSQTSTSFSNSSFSGNAVFYNVGVKAVNPTTMSSADIGIFSPDGAGNVTEVHDKNLGSSLSINAAVSGMTYAVASNGRLVFTGGDSFIVYLVDVNKGFLFDPGGTLGLGFVESQAAAPAGGFTNASASGNYVAGIAPRSVIVSLTEAGLAALDGAGVFQTNEDVSGSGGLIVHELTRGSYSISANGRGLVQSIVVSLAGISPWVFLACIALWLWFSSRERYRSRLKPKLAGFCMLAWVAVVPNACPPPPVNEIVFYVISPTKAVATHMGNHDPVPVVAIFEQ